MSSPDIENGIIYRRQLVRFESFETKTVNGSGRHTEYVMHHSLGGKGQPFNNRGYNGVISMVNAITYVLPLGGESATNCIAMHILGVFYKCSSFVFEFITKFRTLRTFSKALKVDIKGTKNNFIFTFCELSCHSLRGGTCGIEKTRKVFILLLLGLLEHTTSIITSLSILRLDRDGASSAFLLAYTRSGMLQVSEGSYTICRSIARR